LGENFFIGHEIEEFLEILHVFRLTWGSLTPAAARMAWAIAKFCAPGPVAKFLPFKSEMD
jgi:cytochrome b